MHHHLTLAATPAGASCRGVTAHAAQLDDRPALRVELTDQITFDGTWGVDYVDQPTFVILPIEFGNGTIEVDLRSRLNGKGPEESRAFAGLAYRITGGGDRFECVYLRPLNGRKVEAPPIRHQRAVQWFAYPDWPFDRLREEHPGTYEGGADIGPDEWLHLRLDIDDRHVTASVDGVEVLNADALVEPSSGLLGLFVDIGTEAFFADLRVSRR